MAEPTRGPLVLLFLAGLIGGGIAYLIGAPMPFLIGGVVGSALFIGGFERGGRRLPKLHPYVRLFSIGSAGAMIGSRVSPDLLGLLPQFWISALAIIPFIVIAHTGGYFVLRRVGKYPVVDAFYGSMPGGMVEAVILGEQAGARVPVLMVQHFIRVLAIVIAIPLFFLATTGEVVGSASGTSAAPVRWGLVDIAMIAVLAVAGLILGRWLRMPAAHLLGPLTLALVVAVSGVVSVSVPPWLLHTAQYVIGVTLGAQFSGINRDTLRLGLRLGLLSVVYMLLVGYGFAVVLAPHVPADVPAMFISFAAGGLPEMSLIALSLDLSPVIVALHHLARIILALWIGRRFYERYLKPSADPR